MSSLGRRGQVEPLPALVALSAFAIAISVFATTLQTVPLTGPTTVPEPTVSATLDTISEGTVVRPGRLEDLDGTVPEGTTVVVRANGRTWRWGPDREPAATELRHVPVRTSNGVEPGTVRVSV